MGVKQLAISFGIGATIGSSFRGSFKNATTLIETVNKKTEDLRKSQAALRNLSELRLIRKDTRQQINSAEKELLKLKKSISEVDARGRELTKTKEKLSKEITNLSSKEKLLKADLASVTKKVKDNKDINNNLKDKYTELQKEIKNIVSQLKPLQKEFDQVDKKIKDNKGNSGELKDRYIQLQKEIGNITSQLKPLQAEFNEVDKKIKDNKKISNETKNEYNKLQKEIGDITSQLKPLQTEFNKVEKEIKDNSKESSSLNKTYSSLENKIESLNNKQKKHIEDIKETSKNLKEQNISLQDIGKSYEELEKKANNYNKAMEKYQKAESIKNKADKVSSIGGGAIKGASVVTGAGGVLLNSAIKAESAFADVKKQFDFANKEEETKFKKELQSIITEKKMAISLEDLYGMAANAGQSGLKQDEAVPYIEQASKMAIAFNMNRDQASKYMFIWKNAFNMDLTKLKELTDQINTLGNNTGASEDQISEFITRLGNIPKLAGMAENQTAALGASLIEMGMAPEVAATGAKKLLNVLSKGKAADKSEKEALEMLGLDAQFLAKTASKDAEKAMDIVFSKLSKANKVDQSAIMTMLFGEEGKVAASNVLKSYEKYTQNLNLVKNKKNYEGATDKEYENKAGTTENELQNLQSQMELLQAQAGETLLPFLNQGIAVVAPALRKFTELLEKNPDKVKAMAKTIVYGTGALYGIGGALKFISFGISTYSTYTKLAGLATEKELGAKIIKTIGKIGGVAKAGIAALTSPVGLVILGITALVAAGYLLYKNWDTVKKKAIDLKNKVVELVDKYWYMLGPLGHVIKAGRLIYENWDTIKLKASELKDKLVEMVMNGINNFNEFKEKAMALLGIPFDYMASKIENLKNLGKDLKDYFLEIFEEIKNFSLGDAISNGISSLKNKFIPGSNGENAEQTGGFFTKLIPGFATGGFVHSPTLAMVGEGGASEAIIPLTGDSNSMNLWEKTGRLLGAFDNSSSSNNTNTTFNFTYSPVVNAKDAAGVKEVLENDARMSYEQFKGYFDRYQRETYRRGNGR
ncbi:phage tail tape measure protein [Fusobacterium sp.]|uniref:phage tail tape measure protein n=1 Tax=Fusobacterium sp. TaxID=68766 RepID=UPI002E78AECE|nr:phage tail tape measure protein [Fusobacterium sp.]MEE1476553.1 phage tail tape measure protein [Fusobacterium sp.]